MSTEKQEHHIRRILVALDNSPGSLTALREAITLAAGFEAEVTGIFVEDINLVRVAEISFTEEVGLFSATRRRLEIQYVERQFRNQAERVQRALTTLAEQAGVAWSFQTVRGVVAQELLRAASEADLIVLGRVGLSPLSRRQLGSTARAMLEHSPRLTLVLHPGHRRDGPVVILYDGSSAAQRALAVTIMLEQGNDTSLTVLLLAEGPDAVRRLRQEAEQRLRSYGLTARFLWQGSSETQGVIAKIQSEACRMLVIPSDGARLSSETILSLLEELDCPVFMVR